MSHGHGLPGEMQLSEMGSRMYTVIIAEGVA